MIFHLGLLVGLYFTLCLGQPIVDCDEVTDNSLLESLVTLLDSFDDADLISITELLCSNQGFTGELPLELSALTSLQVL